MYGKTHQEPTGGSTLGTFTVGLNHPVKMKEFNLVSNEADPSKVRLTVKWAKADGSERTIVIFPVDPHSEYITPRKLKDGGTQSKEDAVKEAITSVNSTIKHIVCAYIPHEQYDEAMQPLESKNPMQVTSEDFARYVILCKELLPEGWSDMTGTLKLGYHKGNGDYSRTEPSVPTTSGGGMYMGRFWKLDGDNRKDRELDENFGKYLFATPLPTKEQAAAGNAPSQTTGAPTSRWG